MSGCYYELRTQSARGSDSIIADVMRHLHARQHLGSAVIICEQPIVTMATARRQWLKLIRQMQRQRASTLDADKILKYSRTITHMQQARFTYVTPDEDTSADVYFIAFGQCALLPSLCYSVYVLERFDEKTAHLITEQLMQDSLIVDYLHTTPWKNLGLQPKAALEQRAVERWQQVCHFLANHRLTITDLAVRAPSHFDDVDDALDTLIPLSRPFLVVAGDFYRSLEAARPLRIATELRRQHDVVLLLAYRVQTLSPGARNEHFLDMYDEDDTYFLGDNIMRDPMLSTAVVMEAIARHRLAGRHILAKSLEERFEVRRTRMYIK